MADNTLELVKSKAQQWLDGNYDAETKEEVKKLLEGNEKELIDAFYKDLDFGTGGLRGIMGAGTNRMNKYTVGAATQGFANYLKQNFSDRDDIKVVIGHDCRNNSREFSEIVAGIFSANGMKAYLFEDLRPTPEVSYTIRELGCQAGVILTASHNPKEYNGYKVYWDDGGQVIMPHDKNIIDEVNKVTSVDQIKFDGPKENITVLGSEIDAKYVAKIKELSLSPEAIEENKDLKIVYTPIHGTGVKLVPMALKAVGFTNIINIPEQDVVSGDFPTVVSPNPEEPAAMQLALKKAKETDADIVMATDPDSDRVGAIVKDDKGEYILVNGNQTALLLTYYILTKWKENGKLTGKEFMVKTIVTSESLKACADKYGVEIFDVYTGFKWIAGLIREFEGQKQYICGGEESYGFLVGDFVRDKDAVSSCVMLAELTAWAKSNGKTVYELMQDIYLDLGFSKEKLINVVRKGKEGAEEIQKMMEGFRNNPPAELGGSKVKYLKDYSILKNKNIISGTEEDIDLPATSNVLQFFTEDGSKVSVRPSGTEPKIKFYIEVKGEMKHRADFDKANEEADKKIEKVKKDLGV